jgi:hypothetical protein
MGADDAGNVVPHASRGGAVVASFSRSVAIAKKLGDVLERTLAGALPAEIATWLPRVGFEERCSVPLTAQMRHFVGADACVLASLAISP